MPLVTERWSGPKIQYGTILRAVRMFDVNAASPAAAKAAVIAAFPNAAKNQKHPLSDWMYAEDIDPVTTSPGYYAVTVTYSSTPAGRHVDPENPLNEPYQYHFEWGSVSEACDRNSQGNPIQTSAGQSFSNPLPTDVLNGTLVIERNEPFYDAIQAVGFFNSVNSTILTLGPGGIYTLEPGRARCSRIVPVTPITTAAPYVRVRYCVELRAGFKKDSDGYYDGFKLRLEDTGTTGWYSKSGTPTSGPFCLLDGSIAAAPVRLNGRGKPIAAATDLVGGGGPYFISRGSQSVAVPIENAKVPAGTIIETIGDPTTPDVCYIKAFPLTVRLLDLNILGLVN